MCCSTSKVNEQSRERYWFASLADSRSGGRLFCSCHQRWEPARCLYVTTQGFLGLNAVGQPSWNKIWICQMASLLPLFIFFLQLRLNNGHQVIIVTIDKIHSVDVFKFVAVVKQGIETKLSQGQERWGLDLKHFKNQQWMFFGESFFLQYLPH